HLVSDPRRRLPASMTLPAPLAPEEFAAQGAGRVIVDVRDADSFACGHLPGSGHVALESFTERRAELPPRGMPVLVVACDAARARALAARSGVVVGTLICDLEQTEAPLPQSRWDVIVCFRFLHRPLLPRIARALAPGGHLVYETYRRGQERFGKPQRGRFLL